MTALVLTSGGEVGARYVIDKPVFVIGRGSQSDVRVTDQRASRAHARIRKDGDRWIVEDLQGRNELGGGTYVNGQLVRWHVLRAEDEIRIAGVTFRFESPEEEKPHWTAPIGAAKPAKGAAAAQGSQGAAAASPPMNAESREIPVRQHVDGTDLRRSIVGTAEAKPMLAPAHERLLTVYEIANTISTQLDEGMLISDILDALLRVFRQSARAVMLFLDKDTGKLVERAERMREGVVVERFPIPRKVTQQVVGNRQALIFGGVAAGPGDLTGVLSNSMLCAPLVVRGEVLGAIHLTSRDPESSFVADDLDLLVGISSQAAIALKNLHMHAELVARERLRYDVQVAQEIQRRFLPQAPPRVEGWTFACDYKPADAIGTDFYDFIPLGSNRIGVLVGDVSGKGLSGALLMARVTSEFRWAAVTCREPRDVMKLVHGTLAAASYEGIIVTALYATVDLTTGVATFCNAGHVQPRVRRFGVQGDPLEVVEVADAPLGVVDDTVFSQAKVPLDRGDVVLLMSDGVAKSTDAARRVLGIAAVEDLLRRGTGDAEATLEEIAELVKAFVKDAPQEDDLTVLSFARDLPTLR